MKLVNPIDITTVRRLRLKTFEQIAEVTNLECREPAKRLTFYIPLETDLHRSISYRLENGFLYKS